MYENEIFIFIHENEIFMHEIFMPHLFHACIIFIFMHENEILIFIHENEKMKMKFSCHIFFIYETFFVLAADFQIRLEICEKVASYSSKEHPTVPTFNSCTKCVGSPGKIHDRTSGPISTHFSLALMNV